MSITIAITQYNNPIMFVITNKYSINLVIFNLSTSFLSSYKATIFKANFVVTVNQYYRKKDIKK